MTDNKPDELNKWQSLNDKEKALLLGLISSVSLVLLMLVQIPTPDYLNPIGMCFASIFLVSGMFALAYLIFEYG